MNCQKKILIFFFWFFSFSIFFSIFSEKLKKKNFCSENWNYFSHGNRDKSFNLGSNEKIKYVPETSMYVEYTVKKWILKDFFLYFFLRGGLVANQNAATVIKLAFCFRERSSLVSSVPGKSKP